MAVGGGRTESTVYASHYLTYCTAPDDGMIFGRGNRSTWKGAVPVTKLSTLSVLFCDSDLLFMDHGICGNSRLIVRVFRFKASKKASI
jgi:hypothetical protein